MGKSLSRIPRQSILSKDSGCVGESTSNSINSSSNANASSKVNNSSSAIQSTCTNSNVDQLNPIRMTSASPSTSIDQRLFIDGLSKELSNSQYSDAQLASKYGMEEKAIKTLRLTIGPFLGRLN